ncbi:hypothetical protein VTJ83DRAFT_5972 [Remersonia thermophila]|uniref:Haloacid dehalogenase-like hydrolase n=1 Tax=Remersonia thermophila TaxID=72144 RepID=A0ABR4D8C2_9PEZI
MSRLLLLDFDGTITQHDTLDALISLAIAHSTSSPTPPSQRESDPEPGNEGAAQQTRTQEDLTTVWQAIVADYITACEAHRASYRPATHQRTSIEQELEFLESWEPVERASVARVSAAGFFRGLGGVGGREGEGSQDEEKGAQGAGMLMRLGREAALAASGAGSGSDPARGAESLGERITVELRKGFGELMARAGAAGWEAAVVSVNWSDEFIRGVMQAGCDSYRGGGASSKSSGDGWPGKVLANTVRLPEGQILGPQELGGEPLVTAGDKLRAMRWLIKDREEAPKVIYVGDSTTDLACLVEADLGIVIAGDRESKLLKTTERVQLQVPHVAEADEGSRFVWARDFEEVLRSGVLERIGGPP